MDVNHVLCLVSKKSRIQRNTHLTGSSVIIMTSLFVSDIVGPERASGAGGRRPLNVLPVDACERSVGARREKRSTWYTQDVHGLSYAPHGKTSGDHDPVKSESQPTDFTPKNVRELGLSFLFPSIH